MKYLAFSVKGLEDITVGEIVNLDKKAIIINKSPKKVIFESELPTTDLLKLRTIDDLHYLDSYFDVSNNYTLDMLTSIALKSDLPSYLDLIREFREVNSKLFSLTVSTYKSTIKADDIKSALLKGISNKYDWTFAPFDHSNFDIRIILEQQKLYISIKVDNTSLYNRGLKIETYEGALRPSIAAAMVLLVKPKDSNLKLIDTFCGSGTILSEALSYGYEIFGSDINPKAVSLTKSNISQFNKNFVKNVVVADATKSSWRSDYFDVAVSNLPWDKQIRVDSITNLYTRSLLEYKRILKPRAPFCLLVHKPDLLIKHINRIFDNVYITTKYPIGYLGQNPTIVFAKTK